MRSDFAKTFYFHADANPLTGFIEKPFQKVVPPQAPLSLGAVGGHHTQRTEAFNFEEIVSCRAAYTRVSGHQSASGASTLITSVVEGLNILEVVTAERLVAQVTVQHEIAGGFPLISFTGSRFEGLKIGGCDVTLELNDSLIACGPGTGDHLTYPVFQETGRQQAAKLVRSVEDDKQEAFRWLVARYGWMASGNQPDGFVLCSLVNGIGPAIPGTTFGHVVYIPEFGRIFLGEIIAFPASVQLSMVRAELGCSTAGNMNAASAMVNGHMVPP
jgi:hypothetical protein